MTKVLLENERWVSVSADHFFYDDHGVYKFDMTLLKQAHEQCKSRFVDFLNRPDIWGIVVDNTNTCEREFKFYIEEAEKVGAKVISLVVENRHGNKDVHGCPQVTRNGQEDKIRHSLKLQ